MPGDQQLTTPEIIILPGSVSALQEFEHIMAPKTFDPNTDTGERAMAVMAVDDLSVGDTFQGEWPAHVTLLPWFRLDPEQWPVFDGTMQDIIDDWGVRYGAMRLAEERFYGDNNDIRVRSIEFGGAMMLFPMHVALFSLVNKLGARFDKTYTGVGGYSPHLSIAEGREFLEGDVVRFDNVTVVEKDSEQGVNRVTRKYQWEGQAND